MRRQGQPRTKYGLAVKPAHKRWLTDVCGLSHSRSLHDQRSTRRPHPHGRQQRKTCRGLIRDIREQPIEPTAEALLAAIDGYRERARAAGRTVERVVGTYEASWSGFWLARWLLRRGVETFVVQPSSVPADRRARRAKFDGIDAELLLRTLLAWLRGEPRVCSMGTDPR